MTLSVYPAQLDLFSTKQDGVEYKIYASHINKLQDSTVAIETVLGVNPQGNSVDVSERINNVESNLALLEILHMNEWFDASVDPRNGIVTFDVPLAHAPLVFTLMVVKSKSTEQKIFDLAAMYIGLPQFIHQTDYDFYLANSSGSPDIQYNIHYDDQTGRFHMRISEDPPGGGPDYRLFIGYDYLSRG